MILPNFLIIGAAKSGTTAMYHYLKQHPEVFMSKVKEPAFFAIEGNSQKIDFRAWLSYSRRSEKAPWRWPIWGMKRYTTIDKYSELFKNVNGEIAIGEASPIYLYSQEAPKRIKHYIPNSKLIVILRNPVERAYSQFLQHVRDSRETTNDFKVALDLESERQKEGWGAFYYYKSLGLYYKQLKNYYKNFDPEQILVILFEDFVNFTYFVIENTFKFIGVNESFKPDISLRPNVSGVPRNKLLNYILTEPNLKSLLKPILPITFQRSVLNIRNRNLSKFPIPKEIKEELIDFYRADILQLQDCIQKDLSSWLN